MRSWLTVGLLIPLALLRAQDAETGRSKLPPPDFANVAYGPHARNVMDVWLAKSAGPTPLLLYFHGGGFIAGSKENLPAALLKGALEAGISVAAANYRLSPEVVFPTHYLDCARALQFARHSAAAWHLDPARVALTGSSAGGATSLWLAFHDDLADAKSADPIARESTRITCAAVIVAQPTYDPRVIRRLVGESAAQHKVFTVAYGLKPTEADTDRAHELYELAAPITYLTSDDPPVFAYYGGSSALPPPGAKAGEGIHHPNLGVFLKAKMDAVHVECVLRRKEDGGNPTTAEIEFLQRHLKSGIAR
jgi:acetyl esterase